MKDERAARVVVARGRGCPATEQLATSTEIVPGDCHQGHCQGATNGPLQPKIDYERAAGLWRGVGDLNVRPWVRAAAWPLVAFPLSRALKQCREEQGMNPRVFIQTMIALASASLGLVAALAWNEAIKATLKLLGLGESLFGLYAYAVLATVFAIIVLVWLAKLAARVGGDAHITGEAEG